MITRMVGAVAALLVLGGCSPVPRAAPRPSVSAAPQLSTRAPAARPPYITYPARGDRQWLIATGETAGPGLRYRVAVERGIHGVDRDAFGRQVTATLNDPRSWGVRLRRVGPGRPFDFTVYLATPRTRDVLCAGGRDGYTSCRRGDSVVLNVARWVKSVPGIPLAGYRRYMINHEVGHRLGHGHELCPGAGRPAPVMQQQTLGLHECTPYAWPRRAGKPYHGAPGQYADPVPSPDQGRD